LPLNPGLRFDVQRKIREPARVDTRRRR
jgi:hypothetical protein